MTKLRTMCVPSENREEHGFPQLNWTIEDIGRIQLFEADTPRDDLHNDARSKVWMIDDLQ